MHARYASTSFHTATFLNIRNDMKNIRNDMKKGFIAITEFNRFALLSVYTFSTTTSCDQQEESWIISHHEPDESFV